MYNDLLAHGGRDGGALSAKTVYDVHVVMRSSLRFAVDRHLVDHNVAADADHLGSQRGHGQPGDLDRAATRLLPRSHRAPPALPGDSSRCDDGDASR